jgi:nucleolin
MSISLVARSALALPSRRSSTSFRRSSSSQAAASVAPGTWREAEPEAAGSPEKGKIDLSAVRRLALVRAAAAAEKATGSPAVSRLSARNARRAKSGVFDPSTSASSGTDQPPASHSTSQANAASNASASESFDDPGFTAWADNVLADSYGAMRSAVHLSFGLRPPVSESPTPAGLPAVLKPPAPLTPDEAIQLATIFSLNGGRLDPEELDRPSPDIAPGSTLNQPSLGVRLAEKRFHLPSPPSEHSSPPPSDPATSTNARGKRLVVFNLADWTTEVHLRDAFSRFGRVQKVVIHLRSPSSSLNYAFITMSSDKEAEECIKQLNGARLNYCTISVQRPTEQRARYSRSVNLVVRNLPIPTTAGALHDIFSPFGRVQKIATLQHNDGRPQDSAFITMSSEDEVEECIKQLDRADFNGRKIRVQRSRAPGPNGLSPGERQGHQAAGLPQVPS